MTAELILRRPDDDDVNAIPADQLEAAFKEAFSVTIHGLTRCARILTRARQLGRDVKDYPLHLHLLRIGAGQLLVEVLIEFLYFPELAQRIGQLPIPLQRELVEGGRVKVVELRPDGSPDFSMQLPRELPREKILQVFGPSGVRNETEQRLWLLAQREKKTAPVPSQIGDLKIDKEANCVWVGRKAIPEADLARALKALRS